MRGIGTALTATLVTAVVLAACSTPGPDPTPYPTAAPRATAEDAERAVTEFLTTWRRRAYTEMYELIAPADRQEANAEQLATLLGSFDELTGVSGLTWTTGTLRPVTLPPEPRPPDRPVPDPTPAPSIDTGEAPPAATAQPTVSPTPVPPDTPLDGPVPALRTTVDLHFTTDRFATVNLKRQLTLVEGVSGWQVRWTPAMLFPGLQLDDELALERHAPTRGRVVSTDGTVWAMTRDDGVRVYPQEWTAGQTIGYVGEVTAEELTTLEAQGYQAGDPIGRLGLERGAEDLLRGRPGYVLSAVRADGPATTLLERPMVPGAELVITLRREIQAAADAQIAGYAAAGTAVVDPKTGDVWALASAPLLNPNAVTLGTTLSGQPLAATTANQRFNQATQGAYPTGSSFKVFTLAAALQIGVASPATRMSCNGTWPFQGFTFRNYLDHSLPGQVDLLQAMAFSCNTTYMPLSIRVYDANETALTELLTEFGFGEPTGIRHLAEAEGILPDHHYFEGAPRWHGGFSPYGPFDQIQLSIGQGDFLGTPLQMANAYAALGNGGQLWVPRLVIEARLPNGRVLERNEPTVARQISLSQEHLDYVIESMKAVVNFSYGTAFPAFAGFGVQVAGKSGTAETGGPNPNAWFPAIAPADDAQISVATVLVRVPLATGGSDAAPLVRRVMARYFAG